MPRLPSLAQRTNPVRARRPTPSSPPVSRFCASTTSTKSPLRQSRSAPAFQSVASTRDSRAKRRYCTHLPPRLSPTVTQRSITSLPHRESPVRRLKVSFARTCVSWSPSSANTAPPSCRSSATHVPAIRCTDSLCVTSTTASTDACAPCYRNAAPSSATPILTSPSTSASSSCQPLLVKPYSATLCVPIQSKSRTTRSSRN